MKMNENELTELKRRVPALQRPTAAGQKLRIPLTSLDNEMRVVTLDSEVVRHMIEESRDMTYDGIMRVKQEYLETYHWWLTVKKLDNGEYFCE
jgi:hypothetical protein